MLDLDLRLRTQLKTRKEWPLNSNALQEKFSVRSVMHSCDFVEIDIHIISF